MAYESKSAREYKDDGLAVDKPSTEGDGARASAEPHGGAWRDQSEIVRRERRPGLGTGFGESTYSPVREVRFRRAAEPIAVTTLHYNDREGVAAQSSLHHEPARYETRVGIPRGAIVVRIEGEGDPFEILRSPARTYIVGRMGEKYTIAVTNTTDERFEVVGSVDGLDVVSGKPASFDNRGYLMEPWATVRIDGFRTSDDRVAAFRFEATDHSYAERVGKGRNVGVIGLAFFREIDSSEARKRETANPFPYSRSPD